MCMHTAGCEILRHFCTYYIIHQINHYIFLIFCTYTILHDTFLMYMCAVAYTD
jgi:hypothetical protein